MRIVSLVPSLTELICELGLSSYLVGRTGFCIHPLDVLKSVPKVGGTKNINHKKIKALKPTHVIVNREENRLEDALLFEHYVPHIVVTHPQKASDNLALFEQFGQVFNCPLRAKQLADLFRIEQEKCTEDLQRRRSQQALRTLYLIWRDPWMTVNQQTYIADMLGQVGLQVPTVNGAVYPVITDSDANSLAAELILFSTEPYQFNPSHFEFTSNWAGPNVPRLLIDGEMTSWYGPRAITGLQYLRKFRDEIKI